MDVSTQVVKKEKKKKKKSSEDQEHSEGTSNTVTESTLTSASGEETVSVCHIYTLF